MQLIERIIRFVLITRCTLLDSIRATVNGDWLLVQEIFLNLEPNMVHVLLAKINYLSLEAITLATLDSMMFIFSNCLNSNGKNHLIRRVEVNLRTLKVK